MSDVECVFDAWAAEPTQLDIDIDVFKAWTQGVKGERKEKGGEGRRGKKERTNDDSSRTLDRCVGCCLILPQCLSWLRL
jgi:hypothetical protein